MDDEYIILLLIYFVSQFFFLLLLITECDQKMAAIKTGDLFPKKIKFGYFGILEYNNKCKNRDVRVKNQT